MIPAVGFAALGTLVATTALAQAPAPAPAPAQPTTTTVTPPAGQTAAASSTPSGVFTAGKPSAGLLLGDGFGKEPNFYGLGFGVRGGYTLPMNVYLGGTFIYHLGASVATGFGDVKYNVMFLGVEGGYDLMAGPVLVRPVLGLGMGIFKSSDLTIGNVTFPGVSESKFTITPGVMGVYPIGNLYVGADLRYNLVTGSGGGDAGAFALFLNVGMVF
jgi:hypothetical protein